VPPSCERLRFVAVSSAVVLTGSTQSLSVCCFRVQATPLKAQVFIGHLLKPWRIAASAAIQAEVAVCISQVQSVQARQSAQACVDQRRLLAVVVVIYCSVECTAQGLDTPTKLAVACAFT
jgi:hypothetical protein